VWQHRVLAIFDQSRFADLYPRGPPPPAGCWRHAKHIQASGLKEGERLEAD